MATQSTLSTPTHITISRDALKVPTSSFIGDIPQSIIDELNHLSEDELLILEKLCVHIRGKKWIEGNMSG